MLAVPSLPDPPARQAFEEEGHALAIYELTLIKPGREPETRFTDRRPILGQIIRIDGQLATVTSRSDDPTNEIALTQLEKARSPRERQ